MTRQNMDHHAARAGRPRRRDLRFDAWNPPVDGIVDAAALRDLLLRTDLYERVGDPLSPEGIVACAAGLSGLLQGGGTCRLFLTVPIVNPDGLWDRRSDGARTNAALRFALEHTWADPEARDALDLLGYLVSRGRASLGMCLVPRSDPSAADLRTYGHPYEGWAIARDGDRRFLLLPDESGAHRVVARDDDETAVLAARSFENLWSDNHPKPYTDGIPPSVLALIRDRGERNARPREPGVPSSAPRGKPYAPMEVLRFALLRDAPMMPGGRMIGVESAPVAPWPHQAAVARRIVEGYPRSWLLADEVGLGKTIETGLALRSLTLSQTCGRVLVMPPASLCRQWQREMDAKFALRFDIADASARQRLYRPDMLIVSRSLIASSDQARKAALGAARPWDMVVADEAHGARRGTNLARVISDEIRPRCSSLLLATATPMQLRSRDAFDLNRWLGRSGAFDGDDVLSEAYYEMLECLPESGKSNKRLTPAQASLLRATIAEFRDLDPVEWDRSWSDLVIKCIPAVRQEILDFIEGRADFPTLRTNRFVRRLAYASSPLGRTMLRHGRSILRHYEEHDLVEGRKLPRRVVRAVSLAHDARERAFVSALDAFATGLAKKLTAKGRRAARGASFFASFVRLRAASSETAIRRTLSRRLAKVEESLTAAVVREAALSAVSEALLGDDDVAHDGGDGLLKDRGPDDLVWEAEQLRSLLIALEGSVGALPSKAASLLETLASRDGRRAVVFTRFKDTLDEIVSVVAECGRPIRFGTYSGEGGAIYDPRERRLVPRDREEVMAAVQAGLVDLLVCTDAAAEGLNLQGASLLVNYDLPWNPTKVEQRIGRIDRIGQVHEEVEVVNMLYQGSAEERVYARLLARLDAIGGIVGSQQISLIPLSEGDFLTLASSDVPEARKKALVDRAHEAALAAARRAEAREIPPRLLFALYWREAEREATRRVPARLGDLWEALATSPTLASMGFATRSDGSAIDLPDGLLGAKPHMLTIDRVLHEVGLAPDGTRTAFATWGTPAVESIFRLFAEKPLPAFARRLEIHLRIGMRDVPVVGYAVATKEGTRLLTSVDDIPAMGLDLDGTVAGPDVPALLAELRGLALRDYAGSLGVQAVEERNADVARRRRRMVQAVSIALLDQCREDAPFESEIAVIEDRVSAMREGLTVFMARIDASLADEMPKTFSAQHGGKAGRYRVTADALTLRSAIAAARDAKEEIRKGEAGGVRDVAARLMAGLQTAA